MNVQGSVQCEKVYTIGKILVKWSLKLTNHKRLLHMFNTSLKVTDYEYLMTK